MRDSKFQTFKLFKAEGITEGDIKMASPSKILNINPQNDYYNLNLQIWKWRCVGLNSPMPNLNKQKYETNVLLTCLYDVPFVNIACKKGKINN
jgi:hypothetical protein